MADKEAAVPSGRGGGRAGTRKFMPTMPGRRKKAEEGGAAAAVDAATADETFKDLIKQAQSAAKTWGRGRGRGRHQQQRYQVTFGVGGEERPALAAAKQYGRSGGGSGGGGVGGGGGGGRSAGGGRIKSDGAVGADDEALPDLPDSKQDIKSIKPRPPVLDYSQYYPTILPLRVPGEEIWEEADGGPAFQPSALDLAAMPDVPQHPAEDLELFDPEMEDQMFLMQMPGVLPLKPGGGAAAAAGDGGGGAGPGPSSERRRKEAAAATANKAPGCSVRDTPSGRIGKLLVFRSGKVKMQVGDVLMDVSLGLPNQHRQDVVAINPSSNACVFLGDVTQRVLVSPDVLQLLRESSVPEFPRAPEELAPLTRAHRRARGYDLQEQLQQDVSAAAAAVSGVRIKSETN